jgi:extradiol dioxygenase family protein
VPVETKNGNPIYPFHLSLVVPDLKAARNFYVNVLGCRIERDRSRWIDVLFFGHQLTLHQETDSKPAATVDHFGPILDKATWSAIAKTCESLSIEFVRPIRVVGAGTEDESGKFVIADPAGNLIEFKY